MKGSTDNHNERRWSEVFPPHTALTFAAVWDPREGMITFSGAHLLDSEGCAPVASRPLPKDAVDNQSQALTIDMLLHQIHSQGASNACDHELETGEPYSWACDAQTDTDGVNSQFLPQWLGIPRGLSTGLNSPAFASSAALTLMMPESDTATMQHRYSNALRAAGRRTSGVNRTPFRPMPVHKESFSHSDDAVTDEGFFEGRQLPNGSYASLPVLVNLNLNSRFSVTTTSTNQYIEVDFPSELGYNKDNHDKHDPFVSEMSSWQTVHGVDRQFCLNVIPPERPRPRRLRKRSAPIPSPTQSVPASPHSVLSRRRFNHGAPDMSPCSPTTPSSPTQRVWPPRPPTPPPPPSLPTTLKRKASVARAKVMERLQKVGKNDEDGWVCVEVEQRVVHRVEHNIV